jgi:DNA-directed RNA polymerase specialized sigma24 family protein
MKAPILTNSKIAYKLAWEFSSKNNLIEPEELISEALLGYAEALRTYDITKGVPLSSYIYRVVRNQLIDFVKNEALHYHTRIDDVQVSGNYAEVPGGAFDLNDIPEAARSLAEMVLRRSDEFSDNMLGQVYDMAREEGWACGTARNAIASLKSFVRNK